MNGLIYLAAIFIIVAAVFFITTYRWNKDFVTNKLPIGWWIVAICLAQFFVLGAVSLFIHGIMENMWIAVPSVTLFGLAFILWCISACKKN